MKIPRPRLIWVDEYNEEISLRAWFRRLFSKPPPPPEPGTMEWLMARDAERLNGQIAKTLTSSSPYLELMREECFCGCAPGESYAGCTSPPRPTHQCGRCGQSICTCP